MKNRKPLAVCFALALVGGFALAQDAGFQPPINAGLNVPIPTGNSARQRLYTGNAESLAKDLKPAPTVARGRAEHMTVEEIATAIEAARARRAELEKWERELVVAGQSKVIVQRERLAKLGVNTDLPTKPDPRNVFTFGGGLFGGQ